MANTAVQTATLASGTGNSVAVTLSATVKGNLVVVHIRLDSTAETCTSVTDDKSNTYTLSSAVDNTIRVYQAYGVQVTGGTTTVTANFSASTITKRVGADEYGLGVEASVNSQVTDVLKSNTGTGTFIQTGIFTPSLSGELCVMTVGSPSQNHTCSYTAYFGADPCLLKSAYNLSGTQSENPNDIGSFGGSWAAIGQSFKTPPNPSPLAWTKG